MRTVRRETNEAFETIFIGSTHQLPDRAGALRNNIIVEDSAFAGQTDQRDTRSNLLRDLLRLEDIVGRSAASKVGKEVNANVTAIDDAIFHPVRLSTN